MAKLIVLAPVIEHKLINKDIWLMVLRAPELAVQIVAGQFLHVRVSDSYQPLLRRPISISDVNKKTGDVSFIYRVIGEGTQRLSRVKVGEIVDCMGPLGNSFDLTCERPLLVGGGMGIAPLVLLAKALAPRPVEALLAGRNEADMAWPAFFEGQCKAVHIVTDDGSLGPKGTAVDALPALIEKGAFDRIYTCGPRPMMEGVARIAAKAGIPCQVSLEAHMGCGVGACLSCTCETNDGSRKKICTDGPVFFASEVFK